MTSSSLEKADLHTGVGAGRMTGKMKLMSYGLGFSTLMLFIRAIYRTVELSDGWGGRVIHTQVYFSKHIFSPSFQVLFLTVFLLNFDRCVGRCDDCALDVHAQFPASRFPSVNLVVLWFPFVTLRKISQFRMSSNFDLSADNKSPVEHLKAKAWLLWVV